MKEHPKTRRRKGAARLYTSGELNAMIDSLCHPSTKADKGFILVEGILHGLVEQNPPVASENSLNSSSPYSSNHWKNRPRSSLYGEVAKLRTINRKIWKTFTILMLLQFCTILSASVTPARAAGSVEMLSHVGYVDSEGNYRVVGEVQNVGTQAVTFVQVTATFLDSLGSTIDSRFDLTMLNVLLPGRKSPFGIALLDVAESNRVSDYRLSVTYTETSSIPMKLAILSNSNYIDYDGSMHIVGTLKNLGDETLVNAKIVATYYDGFSSVVAVGLKGFDPELTGEIGPYQTVSFEITLGNERAKYVATYELAAESNQYAMIPEFTVNVMAILLFSSSIIVSACFIRRFQRRRINL